MDIIIKKFRGLCNTASDINEHLPTLFRYVKQCNSAIELGVRGCISAWAISAGLLENKNGIRKCMFLNDSRECQIGEFMDVVEGLNVDVKYEWKNDLELQFAPDETFDLVFIDTWHVYGQIRRELDKFSAVCNKYIIMHDTTVDEIDGETVRECGYNYQQAYGRATELAAQTGIPREEILKGTWFGIQEFLANHPEWYITPFRTQSAQRGPPFSLITAPEGGVLNEKRCKDRFFNNNGLMILAKR